MKKLSGVVDIKYRRGLNFVCETFVKVYAVLDDCLKFYASQEKWDDDSEPTVQVALPSIVCVERLACSVESKEYVLQVHFEDNDCQQMLLLSAPEEETLFNWLNAIRAACVQNETWQTHFHDGIHSNGRWACCRSARRTNTGCKETTILGLPRRLEGFNKLVSPPPACQFWGFTVVTKSSVDTSAPGQMSVQKNEELTVLDASDKWIWRVYSKATNRSGLLSQTLLQLPPVYQQPWFFRELSSALALFVLRPHGPGAFLVRSCRKRLVLSINARDAVKHVGIYQTEEGQYYVISTDEFDSLVQLLDHYRRHQVFGVHLQTHPTQAHLNAYWTSDLSNIKVLNKLDTTFAWEISTACYRDGNFKEELLVYKEHSSSNSDREKFKQMTDILLCIHHSNIQRLLALGTDESFFTVVTDYHGDFNLKDYVLNNNVKASAYLKLMADVCAGMTYLGRRGIVHNELIPENCTVHSSSVVITGFHYAQFEGVAYPRNHVSYNRHRLLPPEVADAHGFMTTTTKLDVWSFGVLLWMSFSCPECTELTLEQILGNTHRSGETTFGSNLQTIAESCLRKEPESRANCRDVWKLLRQVEKSLPKESSSKIPKLFKGRSHMTERNCSFSSTSTQTTLPGSMVNFGQRAISNMSLFSYGQRTPSNMSLLSSTAGSSPERPCDVTNVRSTDSSRVVTRSSSSVKSLPVGKPLLPCNTIPLLSESEKKWTSLSDFAGTLNNIRHVELQSSTIALNEKSKSGSSSALSFDGDKWTEKIRSFSSDNLEKVENQPDRMSPSLVNKANSCESVNNEATSYSDDNSLLQEGFLSRASTTMPSSASAYSPQCESQAYRDLRAEMHMSKVMHMAQRSNYKYQAVKREKDAILQASEANVKKHQQELSAINSRLEETVKQLEDAKRENDALRRCVDDNIVIANSTLERVQQECFESEQENVMMKERNETLGQEVELLTEENQSLGEQVVNLLEENRKLKQESDRSNLAKAVNTKAEEIEEMKKASNRLQSEVTQLSNENEKLRKDNFSLSREISLLRAQVSSLQRQMKSHVEKKIATPVPSVGDEDTEPNVLPSEQIGQNIDNLNDCHTKFQLQNKAIYVPEKNSPAPKGEKHEISDRDVSTNTFNGSHGSVIVDKRSPNDKPVKSLPNSILSRLPRFSWWSSRSVSFNDKKPAQHTGIPIPSPRKPKTANEPTSSSSQIKADLSEDKMTKLRRLSELSGVKHLGSQTKVIDSNAKKVRQNGLAVKNETVKRSAGQREHSAVQINDQKVPYQLSNSEKKSSFHEFGSNSNLIISSEERITLV